MSLIKHTYEENNFDYNIFFIDVGINAEPGHYQVQCINLSNGRDVHGGTGWVPTGI